MLLFADGFDNYGASTALLLQGGYGAAPGTVLSATNPRTGDRHLRISGGVDTGPRYVLGGGAAETVGVGYAFEISELPGNNSSLALLSLRTVGNSSMATVVVLSTGALRVTDGTGQGPQLVDGPVCIVPGSYQHFEARATIDGSGLSIEVRINGVTMLNASGLELNIQQDIAQFNFGTSGQGVFGFPQYFDVDDLVVWDASGSVNNDFIGDKKCYTGFPTSDGSDQDWTPSVGSDGFAMLDNVPPLDTVEYLTAVDAADRSTFGIADFPAEIVAIAGVVVKSRIFKSDAGNAKATVGVISGASEDTGDEHALNISPRWFNDVFEVDPATGLPWSLAAANALQTVLTRTE